VLDVAAAAQYGAQHAKLERRVAEHFAVRRRRRRAQQQIDVLALRFDSCFNRLLDSDPLPFDTFPHKQQQHHHHQTNLLARRRWTAAAVGRSGGTDETPRCTPSSGTASLAVPCTTLATTDRLAKRNEQQPNKNPQTITTNRRERRSATDRRSSQRRDCARAPPRHSAADRRLETLLIWLVGWLVVVATFLDNEFEKKTTSKQRT
jgi:hypothetical protein